MHWTVRPSPTRMESDHHLLVDDESWESVCKVENNEDVPDVVQQQAAVDTTQQTGGEKSDVEDSKDESITSNRDAESPVVVKMEFGGDSVSVWQDDPNNPIEIDLTESHIDLEPISLAGSSERPEETFASPVVLAESPPVPPSVGPYLAKFPVGPGEASIRPVLTETQMGMGQSTLIPIDLSDSPIRPNAYTVKTNGSPVRNLSGASSSSEQNDSQNSVHDTSLVDSPSRPLVMLNKLPVNFKFDSSAFNISKSPSKETIQKSLAKLGKAMNDAGLVTSVKKITKLKEENRGVKRKHDLDEMPQKKLGRPKKYFLSSDAASSSRNPYWKKVQKSNCDSTEKTAASKPAVKNQTDYSVFSSRFTGLQGRMTTGKRVKVHNSLIKKGKKGRKKKNLQTEELGDQDDVGGDTATINGLGNDQDHRQGPLQKYFSVRTVKSGATVQQKSMESETSVEISNSPKGRWKKKRRGRQPKVVRNSGTDDPDYTVIKENKKLKKKPGRRPWKSLGLETTEIGSSLTEATDNNNVKDTVLKKPHGRPRKSLPSQTADSGLNLNTSLENTQIKRPHGRPRKSLPSQTAESGLNLNTSLENAQIKRPQGRPRKSSIESPRVVQRPLGRSRKSFGSQTPDSGLSIPESNNSVVSPDQESFPVKKTQGKPRKSLLNDISENSSNTGGKMLAARTRKSLQSNSLENGPIVDEGIDTDVFTTPIDAGQNETGDEKVSSTTSKKKPHWTTLRKRKPHWKSKKYREWMLQEAARANNTVADGSPDPLPDGKDAETSVEKQNNNNNAEKDWQVVDGDTVQVNSGADGLRGIMGEMNKLRGEGKLCDTVLQGIVSCESFSEVTEVKCHACVLAAASPTCRDMFLDQNQTQSSPFVFRFEDTNRSSLMAVLDYIYTGKMTIGKTDVTKVHKLATKMNIKGLIMLLKEIQESLGLKAGLSSKDKSSDTQTVHMGRSLQSTFFMT